MACSSTCHCGRKFNRYSGYLLNLSESIIEELNASEEFQKVKSEYTQGGQTKHFVLCTDCLKKILNRPLTLKDMRFKGGMCMTSNIVYILRESGQLTDSRLSYIKSIDDAGILPFSKDQFKLLIRILKDK